MKNLLLTTTASFAMVLAFSPLASAQDSQYGNQYDNQGQQQTQTISPEAPVAVQPAQASAAVESPANAQAARPTVGGDLRAPSPKIFDKDRQGYFQAGVGTAYGMGLASDSLMYNVNASYNFNMNERFTAKVLADTYFASGSVSSRMLNFGVGGDFFINEMTFAKVGLPYITADAALSNTRDALDRTGTGLAVGGGAGFKFQASQLNWDIGLHYTVLTSTIAEETPSVATIRAAMSF